MNNQQPPDQGSGLQPNKPNKFSGNGKSISKKSPIRPKNPTPPRSHPPSLTQRPQRPSPFAEPKDTFQLKDSPDVKDDTPSEKPSPETDPASRIPTPEKIQAALEKLSKKMEALAKEYADGKINQAQFHAIYFRYTEQREITQRILERNPDSDAWQSVLSSSGQTTFLRNYFEAKIVSYGIYVLDTGYEIVIQGRLRLSNQQLQPIFAKIKNITEKGHKLGPAWRKLASQNWVLIVPGKLTASVVVFAHEPPVQQRKMIEDAHRDFERANQQSLLSEMYASENLVFPHRALLQK